MWIWAIGASPLRWLLAESPVLVQRGTSGVLHRWLWWLFWGWRFCRCCCPDVVVVGTGTMMQFVVYTHKSRPVVIRTGPRVRIFSRFLCSSHVVPLILFQFRPKESFVCIAFSVSFCLQRISVNVWRLGREIDLWSVFSPNHISGPWSTCRCCAWRALHGGVVRLYGRAVSKRLCLPQVDLTHPR